MYNLLTIAKIILKALVQAGTLYRMGIAFTELGIISLLSKLLSTDSVYPLRCPVQTCILADNPAQVLIWFLVYILVLINH